MRRSREQWAQIVEQFGRSGQSQSAFCAQQRLNVGSFRSWLYRLRGNAAQGKVARSATRLLPVRVGGVDTTDQETVIELVVDEAVLRVRGGFGPAYVAELVALLRNRC
jgi:hypothetical protein